MISANSNFHPKRARILRSVCRAAVLVLVTCGIASPRVALAGHHKHEAAYQVIRSVDEGGKKILVGTENNKDHTEKAVLVTAFTDITVDGQKATLHDLKPGMSIQVDLESDNQAATLTATHVNKK